MPARGAAGFTLVELMIVVAIVGILGTLGTYGVRGYIANAKSAEARNSVGQMSKDAATAFARESMAPVVLGSGASTSVVHQLCASATKSVPASQVSIQGHKYQSTVAEWNVDRVANAGFACLNFLVDQPQYYMYSYAAVGSSNPGDTFTASAQGDLNGDGVLSAFQLTGTVAAGQTLSLAPNLLEVRPAE